jgi:hypothetical protein
MDLTVRKYTSFDIELFVKADAANANANSTPLASPGALRADRNPAAPIS